MKKQNPDRQTTKAGFTIIEVMLFLGISGLLLIGVLSGTYSSIATQRYNDSVRGFAEFLRQVYAEVISPESIGTGSDDISVGNSDTEAIYGKLIVFGLEEDNDQTDDMIYTATIVGDPKAQSGQPTFMQELSAAKVTLFCGNENHPSSVDTYLPLWGAKLRNTEDKQFKGSIIIARSPASGTVRTVYNPDERFNLKEQCEPDAKQASTAFSDFIINQQNAPDAPSKFTMEDVDFCLKSQNSRIVRDIRLEQDGHNTSAVNILPQDDEEAKCQQQ